MQLKLKSKIILILLCAGLIPLIVATVISYKLADHEMTLITQTGEKALIQATQNQLVSQRDLKVKQIEDYFQYIRDQMLTFSEDQMVVDAMRGFNTTFKSYESDLNLSDEDLEKYKKHIKDYYENSFGKSYKEQNDGQTPDVQTYFSKLSREAIIAQYQYITSNPNPLGSKEALDKKDDNTPYSKLHGQVHPIIRNYLQKFGYYDIFLVDSETGNIVYSVFKELDYGTSLLNGPVADTNFAQAFKKANQLNSKDEFVLVDFKQYLPSYEAPASFIASPIFDGDKKIGVAIFQMPVDRINTIMASRSGLGETGETLLVGADQLMRSNSHKDPENRSLVASFKNPSKGKYTSESVKNAIDKKQFGQSAEPVTDYLGDETVQAYGPVEILGHTWCLVAKMDTKEAFFAINDMKAESNEATQTLIYWSSIIVLITSVIVAIGAMVFGKKIANPIVAVASFVKKIADGDLTGKCDIVASAEVGQLVTDVNSMKDNLRRIITDISKNSTTLDSTSENLMSTATELTNSAQTMSGQSTTVAAASEEMSINMSGMAESTEDIANNIKAVSVTFSDLTQSIDDIAQNADEASESANKAAQIADDSNTKISKLGQSADEIGTVIQVINDLAEQTNLLALNATIEAARAGEAGKGFAVVATEVKSLAKQTAEATDEIRDRIHSIQTSTKDSVASITEINEMVIHLNKTSDKIARSVETQANTTKEIANNMSSTAASAETLTHSVSQTAIASAEISENIVGVDKGAQITAENAKQATDFGNQMSELASDLKTIVGQFKI